MCQANNFTVRFQRLPGTRRALELAVVRPPIMSATQASRHLSLASQSAGVVNQCDSLPSCYRLLETSKWGILDENSDARRVSSDIPRGMWVG
jgi:hypothetical protein